MNVVTMSMIRDEARTAYREYSAALKQHPTPELRALTRAYGQMARRGKVLDLIHAMQTAGVDDQGRPKLAIARADAEIVFCRAWSDGSIRFGERQWPRANSARVITCPAGTLPRARYGVDCRARVPLVPPRHRPAGDLSGYYILWEAEWVSVPQDPLLLKRLGRNLYAVLAQWDLTPVEQAILRAR